MAWATPLALTTETAVFHVYVPNEKEIRLALREAVYNLYDPWR